MLIDTEAKYFEAKAYIQQHDSLCVDRETNGVDWRVKKTCGVCLQVGDPNDPRGGFYFPFRHNEGPNLPLGYLEDLHQTVLIPTRPQVYHHSSFDIKVGAFHDGYQPPADGNNFDTIIAALLLNENEDTFKLEELAQKYVDKNAGSCDEQLSEYLYMRFGGAKREVKQHLWRAPAYVVEPYGVQDVLSTRRLANFYERHLKNWHIEELHKSVCDFQTDLCRIEMRGVLLDVAALPALEDHAQSELRKIMQRIRELAGYRLNPNSSDQVKTWLETDDSTDKKHLKAMLDADGEDERPQLVLDARGWGKVSSTYYRPYAAFADSEGVLRANLHITTPGRKTKGAWDKRNGTVAGRLSSSNPNLQQIPRESDTYRVKQLFIARPGYLLAELDYSQAELRAAAYYSQDTWLTRKILAGVDLHTAVAKEFDIPRPIAKNINFSIWYGIGFKKFSLTYGVPENESRVYLARYHVNCPGVRRLGNACEARAKAHGYLRLYTSRMRHFNCPEAKTYSASNNLIQGTIAEVMRLSMMEIMRRLPEARIVIQVHDSIWLELREEDAIELVHECRGIMQNVQEIKLPMIVDAKIGPSLGSAESLPRSRYGIPPAHLIGCTDPTLL